jgi:1-acyl-sn-glycerol-3-phosphate acyltransferase
MRAGDLAARAREAARLAGLSGWTILCYVIWLPIALFALPAARVRQAWTGIMQRLWSGGLLRVMGFDVEVHGPVPRKPFFLVSNHLGYMDILVLGSCFGGTFISKHELADWPVLGHLARITGTIFVNRGVKRDALRVLDEIDRAIARGAGVVLFPEGTSSRGDRVYPFRTALLEWAAQREFPVHAATIAYDTGDRSRPAEQAICWWGDMTFVPHFRRMLSLRRVHAVVSFRAAPVVERDRSRLAERLHATLADGFVPAA